MDIEVVVVVVTAHAGMVVAAGLDAGVDGPEVFETMELLTMFVFSGLLDDGVLGKRAGAFFFWAKGFWLRDVIAGDSEGDGEVEEEEEE